MNEYCTLTREEVAALSPDLTKLHALKLNRYTTIYHAPGKDIEKIKQKYNQKRDYDDEY